MPALALAQPQLSPQLPLPSGPAPPSSFTVTVPAQRAAQNLYQALSLCQDGTASLHARTTTTFSSQGSGLPVPASGGGAALPSSGSTAPLTTQSTTYVVLGQALGVNVFNGTLLVAATEAGGATVQFGQGSLVNDLILSRLRSWALNGTQC